MKRPSIEKVMRQLPELSATLDRIGPAMDPEVADALRAGIELMSALKQELGEEHPSDEQIDALLGERVPGAKIAKGGASAAEQADGAAEASNTLGDSEDR